MSFFSGLFGKKSQNTIRQITLNQLSDFGWFSYTRSGASVTPITALQVAAVFCAVRVIAEGCAQVPVLIKRVRVEGNRFVYEYLPDNPAWSLLRKKPNSWQSSFEFREALTIQAALTGNGYAYISRGIGEKVDGIAELIPLPSDYVQPEQTADYEIRYRISDGKQLMGIVPASNILHLRGPSFDMVSGLPAVKLAREAIGLASAMELQQAQLAAAGGRPSGILYKEQGLSDDEKNNMKEAWQRRFGPGGEGGIAVLDKGKWTWQALAMSGTDAQHIENREYQIAEVARAFRVFPQMLMSSQDNKSYNSAEQFFIANVKYTLGPWFSRWEQAIDRDILNRDATVESEFDESGLVSGTLGDQAEAFAKGLGAGGSQAWLTPNDVRARQNLNPLPGGDELPKPAGTQGGSNGTGA